MGLEAVHEVAYPVDEVVGTAVLHVIGQIFAVIFIAMSNIFKQDLTAEAASLQVNLSDIRKCVYLKFSQNITQ